MADVRIQQYPLKSIVSDNDIFLIADSNDVDVNGFLKYKKVRAKDLPSIVNTAESITYANLMASIAADDLIIGTFYKITDSTSGVSPLLVQAVGIDAIGYLAFDASNPLVTINYDVMTDTIRWSKNETAAPISLGSLSATTPLSYNNTTGVFTISQSNATTNGYLSSADWNTFTAKQNAGNYITALTGEATASGPVGGGSAAITLSNSAVIGKVLSGLNITGGNVVSTDSILTAFGKTQNQINALVGGVMFQGVWDAATNNPALTSSVGTKGYYYVVNVAGSTNLNGITDWKVGDWAIFDGTAWQKVDNTDSVSSVFGRVGAVVATEGDYSLTQLSDVTLSSPSNGQVLKYNGTAWVNGTDIDTGLTSVGLTMPSAFSVANSPLTANGTLAVTGAGVASQYVRGDGTLAAFPTTTGGGSSVSYYFNGGTNQGTIGGNTYYEMSTTAVIGTGADFNINTNGYIAQFVTDANDPSLLSIPAGNWNFEMWFSASSNGGSPSFYLELYKYNGATLTLISSGSAVPESITNGTAIDLYTTALAVPLTTLTLTDRLAVRVYVNNSSRTITLHTQNGHLCQAITTFSTGLTALNGLTSQVQYLAVGTSGTDFTISSASSTHTFNLPTASASNRGALSSADWTTFNNKQNALTNPITGTGTINYLPKFTGASALGNSVIYDDGTNIGIGTPSPTARISVLSAGTYAATFNTNDVSNTTTRISIGAFANAAGGTGGSVAIGSAHNHSGSANSDLTFYTFGGTFTEKMRITSAGNVLIGTTTDAGYKLDVNGTARVSGAATFSSTVTSNGILTIGAAGIGGGGANKLIFNYETNAASRSWRMYNDDATFGDFSIQQSTTQSGSTYATILNLSLSGVATFSSSIKSGGEIRVLSGNVLALNRPDNGAGSNLSTNASNQLILSPAAGSSLTLGTGATFGAGIGLNASTAASSGIQFPATQVASANNNNLDDYEEGTFTPSIAFGGASVGITYFDRQGNYTKIGRQVTCTMYIALTSVGTSVGSATIEGLPFTSGGANRGVVGASSFRFRNFTTTGELQGSVGNTSTNMELTSVTTLGVQTLLTNTNFNSASEFNAITITYFV